MSLTNLEQLSTIESTGITAVSLIIISIIIG